jgi:uncharacterized protein (DUF697 family)/GTP-binding protein EngB required for normal cell division
LADDKPEKVDAELILRREDLTPMLQSKSALVWDHNEAQLAKALSQHLVVAFLGSASAGKDSAIRALFGIDFGDVSPIPGSTDRVKAAALDDHGQVVIVNAPGFGDIRKDVDQRARELLDAVDITVYVVNCEGGATIDERNDLAAIRALGRPVLVCLNKIDLIRPNQREEFVDATLAQLGVTRKDAVVCAFDPLPQLAKEPINLDKVITWIHVQLEKSGKDLLFAKSLRNKAAACEPIVLAAARNASIAGAVPIPGADLAVVTAIQVKMIRDIAAVHDAPVDKDVAVFIIGEVLSGGTRTFVRWGLEALKTAGWIPGGQVVEAGALAVSAVIAGATTYGVGRAAIGYFQSGNHLDADKLRMVFDSAAFEYHKRKLAESGGS